MSVTSVDHDTTDVSFHQIEEQAGSLEGRSVIQLDRDACVVVAVGVEKYPSPNQGIETPGVG